MNESLEQEGQPVIEIVDELTADQLQQLADLYEQLSPKGNTTTIDQIERAAHWPVNKLVVAKMGDRVIGVVIVQIRQDLSSTSAEFDDVVVDSAFRGRGFGERLLQHAIEVARAGGAEKIYLTANNIPERDNAKKLYEKVGFEKRDTTPYKLKLSKRERSSGQS